jgi:sulfonate transport system permease protein
MQSTRDNQAQNSLGKSLHHAFLAALIPVVLFSIWDLSVRFGLVPPSLVASPEMTCQAFQTMLNDGTLAANCLISAQRLLLGFTAGTLLGIIVGMLMAVNQTFCRLLEPTISVIGPIPPIAWVPFLIMLLGIGELSKISLIALGTFFIVITHTIHGIRSVDHHYIELAKVLGKNRLQMLLYILLPSALPEIFTGLRVAMGLSWTLLLVSEIIASSKGLGWLIWDARNFSRADDLIAGMIVVGILGRCSDLILVSLERRLTRWRITFGTWQDNVARSDYSY